MYREFNSLTSKNTGTLVPSPGTDKTIRGMWRLVRKRKEFREVLKYKACWVCFGNHQEHQVNYFKTYSAVACTELFKVPLSILVNPRYSAYQFDVETAFLYSEMDAPNYVAQVASYEVSGKEYWVWKLNKSLYGTKQAPRQWKVHLVKTLNTLGLTSKDTDECLFTNHDKTLFLHIHVDYGFIVGKSESMIEDLLTQLNQTYTIKTKKNPTQHLGYTLSWQLDGSIILHQHNLCTKILNDLNMTLSNSIKTPALANIHNVVAQTSTPFSKQTMQKAIGMLNYLALHTHTWPDIMFTTNLLSQFVSEPTMSHWNLVKHLLCHLNGTRGLGIHYTKAQQHKDKLVVWADADYATFLVTKKSHSGYLIMFLGNPISWTTKKQSIVAQSTTKVEFVSMNKCSKEVQWLSHLITSLNIQLKVPILKNDNTGAITISNEAQLNPNSKHIEVRFQYLRNLVRKNLLKVQHVPTNEMAADVLTKALGTVRHA
ncbi:hypothetical protein O181_048935 [Austropuccinia psidii MF-1]|uniref:Reverse transcriptase Ty1/copia-type domain-containing protein n=1 Tax=Austropuccinia psidii MF-1 TaxID=1389203 RepID=A0A9Q3DSR0_9BASI|nr:hypothetical protein [Austropuccinia psidii MF-1]